MARLLEAPFGKFQFPNNRLEGNPDTQVSILPAPALSWSLSFEASLVFGAWCLEFSRGPPSISLSWSCSRCGVLVKHFVDGFVKRELDILAQGQPGQDLRFLRRQFEVLLRVELNSHPFRISELLHRRIDPLIAVLVEAAPGDETRLLRVLSHARRLAVRAGAGPGDPRPRNSASSAQGAAIKSAQGLLITQRHGVGRGVGGLQGQFTARPGDRSESV